MKNISNEIYNYYKQLNIFNLAYGKWANKIKAVIIISGIIVFSFYSVYFDKNKVIAIISLGLFGIIVLLFMNFTNKKIIKKHGDLLERYSFKLDGGKVKGIQLILLYECLLKDKLFTVDGLKYLINIYERKSNENRIKNLAVGVIIISAIINNIIYVGFMGEEKDFQRLYNYCLIIKANISIIYSILIFIFLIVLVIKFFMEPYKEMKKIMFGENYKQLLNILELNFLPIALENAEVSATISVDDQIHNKESHVLNCEKDKYVKKYDNFKYNKEIYKHISEIYKLRKQRKITRIDYLKKKREALSRIKF